MLNQNKADAATVATTHSGSISHLYTENGKMISNRALAPNTPWLVGKITTINGETMYQVSTHEYLSSKDSSLNGQSTSSNANTGTVLTITGASQRLYNDTTKSLSNRALATNTKWQVGKVVTNSKGERYYQVSTHEWVKKSYSSILNHDTGDGQYIADFMIKDGSSSNTSSNTNDDNQTTTTPSTDNNNNENTDINTSTPSGETNADASQSEYQQAILSDLNKARAEKGLAPLQMNSTLNAAATTRAKEIATNFSHTRPDGSLNASATNNPKYTNLNFGENIDAINDNGHMSASRLEQEHLARYLGESGQGHYKNWQFASYKTVGIAVYHANDGFYYVVEDMATI
jgi:uncharacterized protein YkwD